MKNHNHFLILLVTFSLFFPTICIENVKASSLSQFLERFYKNPAKVMDEVPLKKKMNHHVESNVQPLAGQQHHFFKVKNNVRESIRKKGLFSKAHNFEDVSEFIETQRPLLTHLIDMETANLLTSHLTKRPWSDDYWPIKNGILGFRYGDMNMKHISNSDWKELFKFIEKHPVKNYVYSGQIDRLSPSEKYDLLINDSKGTFTKSMWDAGREFVDENGAVEPWMGICHGWAAASLMLPRPQKGIVVKSFSKKIPITFYPSDIKALGSLLWARGSYHTKFLGSRCDEKNPKKDSVGRILDQKCFDNNPASWHLALINQIGVNQQGFIIDATYDYEVWNQPVVGYSYRYFNPQTGEKFDRLDDAVIDLKEFKRDLFRSYRSKQSSQIVGIEMHLQYVAEVLPVQSILDSSGNDSITDVVYRYDLELSRDGKILGGEWYTNLHPDFLWVPYRGQKVRSPYDENVKGFWNPLKQPLQEDWSIFAKKSAALGLPLGKIVESLFWASQEGH